MMLSAPVPSICAAATLTPWRTSAAKARNRDRIGGYGRYDVDERHQPVVFVIEAVAMHHEEPRVIVEPGADREDAGLDHALVDPHGRGGDVGVVHTPSVRAGPQ